MRFLRVDVFAHRSQPVFKDQSSILIKARALSDLSDVGERPVLRLGHVDVGGAGGRVVWTVVVDLFHDTPANVEKEFRCSARVKLVVIVGQRQTR